MKCLVTLLIGKFDTASHNNIIHHSVNSRSHSDILTHEVSKFQNAFLISRAAELQCGSKAVLAEDLAEGLASVL